MTDVVLAVGHWRTNAEMIEQVATLPGYLTNPDPDGEPWEVLDATYGPAGGFWTRWRPELLVTNDLRAPADLGMNFKRFAWTSARSLPDGWCDVVVFDPDYQLKGGASEKSAVQDRRFGVDEKKNRETRLDDIVDGAVECYRLCRRRLLVKCQDQVEGGIMRWQTDLVTRAIEEQGGRKMDRFDFGAHREARPQPETRPCRGKAHDTGPDRCVKCGGSGEKAVVQRTARHAGISQALMFEKPLRRRRA